MSPLARAQGVVAEMRDLGAQFTVLDDFRWTWQPHPEDMRGAIRRFWRSVEDRPSGGEMVVAIRLMKARS